MRGYCAQKACARPTAGPIVVSPSLMERAGPSGSSTHGLQQRWGRPWRALESRMRPDAGVPRTPIGPAGSVYRFLVPVHATAFGLALSLAAAPRPEANDRRRLLAGRLPGGGGNPDSWPRGWPRRRRNRPHRRRPSAMRDPQFAPHGVFPCAGEEPVDRRGRRRRHRMGETGANWSAAKPWTRGFRGGWRGRKAQEDRLEALIEAWTSTRDVSRPRARAAGAGHRRASSRGLTPTWSPLDPRLLSRAPILSVCPIHTSVAKWCPIEASRVVELSEAPPGTPAPLLGHFGRDSTPARCSRGSGAIARSGRWPALDGNAGATAEMNWRAHALL